MTCQTPHRASITTPAAEAEVQADKAKNYSQLDAFAQYQWQEGTILGASGDSWLAGLRANYPFYDGGERRAIIAQAKARVAALKAERDKIILAIRLESERAETACAQMAEKMAITGKMIALAEESPALNRTRFKEGLVLTSELIENESRLAESRAKHIAAKTARRIAKADLRRARGETR